MKKLIFLFAITALYCAINQQVWAEDTGWLRATSYNNYNVRTPNYALSPYRDDYQIASFYYSENPSINFGGFGIAIPEGKRITGIEVQLIGSANPNNLSVNLSWNNGSDFTTTSNRTNFSSNYTLSAENLGGPVDLWGKSSWTASDLSNGNFLVRLALAEEIVPGSTDLDFIAVKVYYQSTTSPITFLTNGTFVVPEGVTEVTVQAWGAGGKGGGNFDPPVACGGGGGGAYASSTLTVTPGAAYTVQVGRGDEYMMGLSNSWFGSTSMLLAKGGSIGSNRSAGDGGSAADCIGDVKYGGGNGASGDTEYDDDDNMILMYSGGGGSSAGTTSEGNSTFNSLGAIAPEGGGNGGNGVLWSGTSGPGSAGTFPGGGGGGAISNSGDFSGGDGGGGQVIVTWGCEPVTPTVFITSTDADNKICLGTGVTFTATPGNTGGGTVSYRWVYNGVPYDTWDQGTYWSQELEDGDELSCEITVTGGTCLTSTTAVSNIINNEVYDRNATPSVTIISNASGEICYGTGVRFTAIPENTGGGEVSYQWKYNGNPIGSESETYWSEELEDGDVVSCEITVNDAACFTIATATSNIIVTDVIPEIEVTITSDDDDNIVCEETSVTFTATPLNVNDGTVVYTWVKNDEFVGSDQNTYTATSLENGDQIYCAITVTGSICPSPNPAPSNVITMKVNPLPTASIISGSQYACESTLLTAATNAANPVFSWYQDDVLNPFEEGSSLEATQPGSYRVKVTEMLTGCATTSDEFLVSEVSQMPLARTVTAVQSAICPGEETDIRISESESDVFYQLRDDDGDIDIGFPVLGNGDGLLLPTGRMKVAATYNVLATRGSCSIEMQNKPSVTMLDNTEPVITEVTAVPAIICSGGSTTLTVTGSLGGAAEWKWYSGSCGSTLAGTGTSITVSPTENTDYYVRGEGGCITPFDCASVTVTVETTPVAGTLAKTPDVSTVCEGSEVSATLTPGSGGIGSDELEYRTMSGSTWSNWGSYEDEDPISTTGMSAVEIRTRRLADACNPSEYNTVSWLVEASPIAAILVRTPDLETVCEGTAVWAYLSEGPNGEWSGGNGLDQTQYRTHTVAGWSDWLSYASGTSISTTGKTAVEIRTRHMADVCQHSAYNTVTWDVEATPVAAILTRVPDGGFVCIGTDVMVTYTPGSGGNGIDEFMYRTRIGLVWSFWRPYIPGSYISTTDNVDVEIKTRRLSNTCKASPENIVWFRAPQYPPVVGTLARIPDVSTVCGGTEVYVTLTHGSGGGGDEVEYRTKTGSNWSDWRNYYYDYHDLTNGISTTGKTGVEVRTRRFIDYCTPTDYITVSWAVETTPVSGTLAKTPDVSKVCEGSEVSAMLTPGSGGDGKDEFVYRTKDVIGWSEFANYTPGILIGTSGKTAIEVLTRRMGTYCTPSEYNTVSWEVESTPVAGILDKDPDMAGTCEGTSVKVTLNAGSGGNGYDELEFRTVTGRISSDWTTYISGTEISTAGKSGVQFITRRMADVCLPSSYNIAIWSVEATPVAGTLVKTPDEATLCEGSEVSATLTPGSGGTFTDELEFQTKTGTSWSGWTAYVSGNAIPTTGKSGVEVRTRRISEMCDHSAYNTVSWEVNLLPVITLSDASTSAQYSDPIIPVTITVTDDGALSSLTASAKWKQQSDIGWTDGLPGNLSLVDGTANDGVWTLDGIANIAPGSYTIKVAINDVQCSSSVEITLTVTQEDALVDYIGTEIVGEANPVVNSTPVNLVATITDIADGFRGDIRNAKVMFLLNGTTPLSGWLTPTLVSPADLTQGIVSYVWNAPVPSVGYTTYEITIKVGTQDPLEKDGYYKGPLDQVPINVYRTSLNEFITGAGHIIPVDSKGEYASDPGRKVNFGFNVKWNKTMKNLQGNFNLILRRGSEIYQIKSNALSGLGIDGSNPCSHKAVFSSKANLNRVTGGVTENIMGNLSLQLTITDNGEPGVTDMIGITLYNGSTLLYSSSWPLSSTEELTLVGGNILIHDGLICNASDITHTVITSSKNPSLTGEDVTFTATVYGHDATPQGNLVFMINGESFNLTLDSKGVAIKKFAFGTPDTYEVIASYTSTNGYKPSTGNITQLVNGTSFILTSSQNPSVFGDVVTFTAKLIGTGDAPDGEVTFKDDGLIIETVSLDGDGQATTTIGNLDFGPNIITVEFEGNYEVEPASLTQVVNNVSISLASSKNPSALTETVTFIASVSGSNSVGKTVTFIIGGNTLSGIVDASGNATATTSFSTSGTHVITATLDGTSISASFNQLVQQPTLVLTSSKNPSAADESVTFTATVTGGAGGNVTFTSGSTTATQPLLGGVATWTTSFTAGSYLVTASYVGTNGSLTQVVNTTAPTLSVTLTASTTATSVVYGTNITFTAIVNNSATAPSGTITFKDNTTILKVVTVSGGKASFSTNKLVVGEHSITATYDLTKTVSNAIKLEVKAKTKSVEIATGIVPDIEYADLKVYPNPFSERLRFEFVSPVDDHVLIQIFDMTGRMVNTVFDNPVNAGITYNTEFKPTSLITGMYFYRMTMGENVFTGKVIYKK